MNPQYWLMKSEPNTYSIDDLKKDKKTCWEGVRNYQARNFMRDKMKVGDLVLFYHSNAEPPGIAGIAKIASKTYPDPFQFDKKSKYFDEKSKKENPRWWLVDISFVKKFSKLLSLAEIKTHPKLKTMYVAKKGMRLSVQPVEANHFQLIEKNNS